VLGLPAYAPNPKRKCLLRDSFRARVGIQLDAFAQFQRHAPGAGARR
jgi:hypothetical protein